MGTMTTMKRRFRAALAAHLPMRVSGGVLDDAVESYYPALRQEAASGDVQSLRASIAGALAGVTNFRPCWPHRGAEGSYGIPDLQGAAVNAVLRVLRPTATRKRA